MSQPTKVGQWLNGKKLHIEIFYHLYYSVRNVMTYFAPMNHESTKQVRT